MINASLEQFYITCAKACMMSPVPDLSSDEIEDAVGLARNLGMKIYGRHWRRERIFSEMPHSQALSIVLKRRERAANPPFRPVVVPLYAWPTRYAPLRERQTNMRWLFANTPNELNTPGSRVAIWYEAQRTFWAAMRLIDEVLHAWGWLDNFMIRARFCSWAHGGDLTHQQAEWEQ